MIRNIKMKKDGRKKGKKKCKNESQNGNEIKKHEE